MSFKSNLENMRAGSKYQTNRLAYRNPNATGGFLPDTPGSMGAADRTTGEMLSLGGARTMLNIMALVNPEARQWQETFAELEARGEYVPATDYQHAITPEWLDTLGNQAGPVRSFLGNATAQGVLGVGLKSVPGGALAGNALDNFLNPDRAGGAVSSSLLAPAVAGVGLAHAGGAALRKLLATKPGARLAGRVSQFGQTLRESPAFEGIPGMGSRAVPFEPQGPPMGSGGPLPHDPSNFQMGPSGPTKSATWNNVRNDNARVAASRPAPPPTPSSAPPMPAQQPPMPPVQPNPQYLPARQNLGQTMNREQLMTPPAGGPQGPPLVRPEPTDIRTMVRNMYESGVPTVEAQAQSGNLFLEPGGGTRFEPLGPRSQLPRGAERRLTDRVRNPPSPEDLAAYRIRNRAAAHQQVLDTPLGESRQSVEPRATPSQGLRAKPGSFGGRKAPLAARAQRGRVIPPAQSPPPFRPGEVKDNYPQAHASSKVMAKNFAGQKRPVRIEDTPGPKRYVRGDAKKLPPRPKFNPDLESVSDRDLTSTFKPQPAPKPRPKLESASASKGGTVVRAKSNLQSVRPEKATTPVEQFKVKGSGPQKPVPTLPKAQPRQIPLKDGVGFTNRGDTAATLAAHDKLVKTSKALDAQAEKLVPGLPKDRDPLKFSRKPVLAERAITGKDRSASLGKGAGDEGTLLRKATPALTPPSETLKVLPNQGKLLDHVYAREGQVKPEVKALAQKILQNRNAVLSKAKARISRPAHPSAKAMTAAEKEQEVVTKLLAMMKAKGK